jgi:hypothetical protein
LPEQPSLQELIHWSLRRDNICIPQACDDSVEIYENDDPKHGRFLRRERCNHCELDVLDRMVAQVGALHRAFDIDFMLQAGIHLTADDLDIEEFFALKTLRTERNRYQEEQNRNKPAPSF